MLHIHIQFKYFSMKRIILYRKMKLFKKETKTTEKLHAQRRLLICRDFENCQNLKFSEPLIDYKFLSG